MKKHIRGETLTEVITAAAILTIVSGYLTMGFLTAFKVIKENQYWRRSLGVTSAVLEIGADSDAHAVIDDNAGDVTIRLRDSSAAFQVKKVSVAPTDADPKWKTFSLYEVTD